MKGISIEGVVGFNRRFQGIREVTNVSMLVSRFEERFERRKKWIVLESRCNLKQGRLTNYEKVRRKSLSFSDCCAAVLINLDDRFGIQDRKDKD